MAVTDYTDYDSIRAVLGVSVDEIGDTTMALNLWWTLLYEALYDVAPDLPTVYTTTKALPTPTPDQTRFLDLASAFATYCVASKMLGQLPIFSPQTMKGVKQEFTRIPGAFDSIKLSVSGAFSDLKVRLGLQLQVINPSDIAVPAVTRVLAGTAGLAYDPVTGC